MPNSAALRARVCTSSLPEGFYEFGLSPEDEARQVAEQAWLGGRTGVLALTQDGDWGERVYRAFEKRWTQLGGQVLAREVFAAGEDLSPRVRDLLQFRRSEGGSRSYEGRYDGSPHGDFLFMVALPDQARQIGPRLRYYGTADLPVYATSHAFAGRPDRETLRDLEGVVFLDLPWVLSPESADAGLRTQVAQAWPDQFDTYQRLYALGVDAYRLLPYLPRLAHEPSARLSGVTGSLRIEDGHRVVREARWARVEGAQVRLLQENEHWRP